MTNQKSKIHYQKCQKLFVFDFYIFLYVPVSKAFLDSEHTDNLYDKDLRRRTLPSAFTLIKEQKVQGPQINIAYSRFLDFNQLKNIDDLNAFCFKLRAKWYAHYLLKELGPYQEPLNLCCSFQNSILKKVLNLKLQN
jgi:hypothetical protein